MVKLNRTTEYGLIALHYMSQKKRSHPGEITSAREVVDRYKLPFEITAKTLQRLKDSGIIGSEHGARGGYHLLKNLEEISLGEFLKIMEGDQSLVACCHPDSADTDCSYSAQCEIQPFLTDVNSRMIQFLSSIRLAEIKISHPTVVAEVTLQ